MLPTVAQILALDAVRAGRPRVVAGAGRLDAPVRWVHAIELADAARLLRGGELVLTTGIALPEAPALLDEYVADLAGVGVSAVAVELGRTYTGALPASFAQAAEDHGLPLIVFEQEVPFIAITEAVHALIIEDQLTELRASARLHEVFTDLAVAGAGPGEILRQAALLAGRPVILEDLSHHVLACEPSGADPARLLDGFDARSRAASQPARTAYDESSGWLITMVGARGEDWGRVILVCGAPPGGTDTVLVERTATTLALGRLLARQHESLERQAHATLISAILAQAHTHPEEAAIRVRALGVPLTRGGARDAARGAGPPLPRPDPDPRGNRVPHQRVWIVGPGPGAGGGRGHGGCLPWRAHPRPGGLDRRRPGRRAAVAGPPSGPGRRARRGVRHRPAAVPAPGPAHGRRGGGRSGDRGRIGGDIHGRGAPVAAGGSAGRGRRRPSAVRRPGPALLQTG